MMSVFEENCRLGIANGELVSSDSLPEVPAGATLVYEVVRLIAGVPLFLEDHVNRLNRSLSLAALPGGMSLHLLKDRFRALAEACSITDRNIRLDVWRWEADLIWTARFVESHYPSPEAYRDGVAAGLLAWERHNPEAKVWQANLKETVADICAQRDLHELILVDSQGRISEGSRSNLFLTQGERLFTAPDSAVLGGITRLKLLELIEEMGIELVRSEIGVQELETFDGAFLTGTSIHLLPLSSIEAWRRQSARQPLIEALQKAFDEKVTAYIRAHSPR